MSQKLKVTLLSDLHGNLPTLAPTDLLLLGGDLCPDFMTFNDKGEQRQRDWLENDFRQWLLDVPADQVVGIAGNHDFVFEHSFLIPKDLRWRYLKDEAYEYKGLKLWGTPWVPNLPRWAFHASEKALKMRAALIPSDVDILISHGPPRGYADIVDVRYGGPKPVGDEPLADWLLQNAPRYLVCGHIHEAYGRYEHPNGTTIFNSSLVNLDYEPVNPIVQLELSV